MPVRHHTVQVPATSANLGPGYDAYGLALDLHLVVRSLPRSAQRDRVVSAGEGRGDVVNGDQNLLWRAFVRFCERQDQAVPDVALWAMNRIPLERGLGSSSSAIVAGMVLARALTGARIGDRELVALASEVEGHPDNVAPALLGGLVACTADDAGNIVVRRINPAPGLRPILLVPSFRQATSAARGALPSHLDVVDVTLQASRSGHVLGALSGLWPVASAAAGDRLHEPARSQAMAASGEVLRELRAAGLHAWLSGAGPSIAVDGGSGPPVDQDGTALVRGFSSAGVEEADDTVLRVCRDIGERQGFVAQPMDVELSGALACPDDGCALAGTGGCVQCPRERLS